MLRQVEVAGFVQGKALGAVEGGGRGGPAVAGRAGISVAGDCRDGSRGRDLDDQSFVGVCDVEVALLVQEETVGSTQLGRDRGLGGGAGRLWRARRGAVGGPSTSCWQEENDGCKKSAPHISPHSTRRDPRKV